MKDSLIIIEHGTQTVLGNINISSPYYVEVQIIAPYRGFVNSSMPKQEPQWDEATQRKVAENLLNDSYLICSDISRNGDAVRIDFLKLIANLKSFHNEKSEAYIRNYYCPVKNNFKKITADFSI